MKNRLYTRRGIVLILKAIKESKVDVTKPYDLYEITKLLGEYCIQSELNKHLIGTTGEVIKAIEYIKENNLI